MFGKLDQAKAVEDIMAAYPTLEARSECNGKIGAVGFCRGGLYTNVMATRIPGLLAAVPYYGPPPNNLGDAAKIKAPMLVQLDDTDNFVNSKWLAWEEALKAIKRLPDGAVERESDVYRLARRHTACRGSAAGGDARAATGRAGAIRSAAEVPGR
jgi:dienelactone hydrolase